MATETLVIPTKIGKVLHTLLTHSPHTLTEGLRRAALVIETMQQQWEDVLRLALEEDFFTELLTTPFDDPVRSSSTTLLDWRRRLNDYQSVPNDQYPWNIAFVTKFLGRSLAAYMSNVAKRLGQVGPWYHPVMCGWEQTYGSICGMGALVDFSSKVFANTSSSTMEHVGNYRTYMQDYAHQVHGDILLSRAVGSFPREYSVYGASQSYVFHPQDPEYYNPWMETVYRVAMGVQKPVCLKDEFIQGVSRVLARSIRLPYNFSRHVTQREIVPPEFTVQRVRRWMHGDGPSYRSRCDVSNRMHDFYGQCVFDRKSLSREELHMIQELESTHPGVARFANEG